MIVYKTRKVHGRPEKDPVAIPDELVEGQLVVLLPNGETAPVYMINGDALSAVVFNTDTVRTETKGAAS